MITYGIDDNWGYELYEPLPRQYDLSDPSDLEELAYRMCDDYHNNGGWENDFFPIKLTIINDNQAIANFEVYRECKPDFSVYRIDDDEENS